MSKVARVIAALGQAKISEIPGIGFLVETVKRRRRKKRKSRKAAATDKAA